MTEQEAIKEIENDLEWHSKELKPKYKEVLRFAIKVLEKQMPKKMKFIPKKFPCDYKCPNGCKQYDEYKINYCPNCGQKIDWGDE